MDERKTRGHGLDLVGCGCGLLSTAHRNDIILGVKDAFELLSQNFESRALLIKVAMAGHRSQVPNRAHHLVQAASLAARAFLALALARVAFAATLLPAFSLVFAMA